MSDIKEHLNIKPVPKEELPKPLKPKSPMARIRDFVDLNFKVIMVVLAAATVMLYSFHIHVDRYKFYKPTSSRVYVFDSATGGYAIYTNAGIACKPFCSETFGVMKHKSK